MFIEKAAFIFENVFRRNERLANLRKGRAIRLTATGTPLAELELNA